MDSYQRIKELILEGSLGFMRGQRLAAKTHKSLDVANKSNDNYKKYAGNRDALRAHSEKRQAKRFAKKGGGALYPFGRSKTKGLP